MKSEVDELPEKLQACQGGSKHHFWYKHVTSMLPEEIYHALKQANESGNLKPV